MSTQNRREEKGSRFGLILTVVVVIAVAAFFAITNYSSTTEYTSSSATSSAQIISEDVSDPYDDIRNREEIKRQQELIVLETFLNEERTRVEKEKTDAIAKFDSEIANLETKLEEVRGEKLSFQ